MFQGFIDSAAVFAKDSKIAKHGRIRRSCGDHFFVNRFGFSKSACFVGINGLVEPFLKVQLRLFG